MKETETIKFFAKAMHSLNCKKVLNPSVPKGVMELHVNPEDDEALNKMNLNEKMVTQASYLMLSDLHGHQLGKEATDRVLQDAKGTTTASSRSWFTRFF